MEKKTANVEQKTYSIEKSPEKLTYAKKKTDFVFPFMLEFWMKRVFCSVWSVFGLSNCFSVAEFYISNFLLNIPFGVEATV